MNPSKGPLHEPPKEGLNTFTNVDLIRTESPFKNSRARRFSVAPADSHPRILKEATKVLKNNGGNGAVREFVEYLLNYYK